MTNRLTFFFFEIILHFHVIRIVQKSSKRSLLRRDGNADIFQIPEYQCSVLEYLEEDLCASRSQLCHVTVSDFNKVFQ